LKIKVFVIIRFLFFYSTKIGNLVSFEQKTTEHGLKLLFFNFSALMAPADRQLTMFFQSGYILVALPTQLTYLRSFYCRKSLICSYHLVSIKKIPLKSMVFF